MNTFDDLKFDALRIVKNVTILGIGSLILSKFFEANSFGVNMIEVSLKHNMHLLDLMIT